MGEEQASAEPRSKEGQPTQDQYVALAEQPGAVAFAVPNGWRIAEKNPLTPYVEILVVGHGKNTYPPSLNLVVEPYTGTLKSYLKRVKAINAAHHSSWKDLGTIHTAAGNASLSQLDLTNEWGHVRMMHVMLVKADHMYILTAAALKDEFADYYKDFFSAFRSLRINAPAPTTEQVYGTAQAAIGIFK